jgi:electron-transferring-flavoprotein dehydrogenase
MADVEREVLEVDVLFVGAGPASLAGALRLAQLLERHEAGRGADGKDLSEVTVVVIEKAAEVGFHSLSGAVMDPRGLAELVPDYRQRGCPIEADVHHDEVWYLHETQRVRAPFVPKVLQNEGFHVVSLGRLTRWMAGLVEETGKVELFTSTAGAEVLYDGDRVVGVRTGDKGVAKDGSRRSNFEPGMELRAKVTVLGEGVRGNLAKTLVPRLGLDKDSDPQVYSVGVKELWKLPAGTVEPGRVVHTMGWPLDDETFGGGFVYTMADDIVDVGLVVGLDYKNPNLEPHLLFQRFKTHPEVQKLIAGGKLLQYGSKALPEGGWWTVPRPYAAGVLLAGDVAAFLNPMRLKGVHTAVKTGMLAAEAAFEALLEDDFSEASLARYHAAVNGSWVAEELRFSRHFHAGFRHGTLAGLVNAGAIMLTNGEGLFGRGPRRAGHQEMEQVDEYVRKRDLGEESRTFRRPRYDGALTFDKLTDLYHSGTKHEENQPSHLVVTWSHDLCATKCAAEYNNPCTRFCPAQVYNMVEDPGSETGRRLQIDFANCVHCKTCDIMDPYQVIEWLPPEGGDGPRYDRL